MKRSSSRFLVTFVCVVAFAFSCRGRKNETPAGGVQTQTVAPAAAQPSPTGTDAMTQTVDVGDGRSEADGGVTTDSAPTVPQPAPGKTAVPSAKKNRKKK